MKKEVLQLKNLIDQFKRATAPIVRHHIVISIVAVCGVMIFSVLTVNQILTMPSDQEYINEKRQQSIKTRFDQATIMKIEQLKDREQNTSLSLPGGRISPFTE